jgi:REP element-mobilizing transposase RayT
VILAFHSIFSSYGFWLPNEERGSRSTFVANWELFRYGPATKVDVRYSVAKRSYDRDRKRAMRETMTHEPVRFTGAEARIVGQSLREVPYDIFALAVMHDHVHLVLGRMDRDIRKAAGHITSVATKALRMNGHYTNRPVWADHGWNVYLDSVEDVERAIRYVERNPVREGKPVQRWSCVKPCRAI